MNTTSHARRCPGPLADMQRRSFLAGGLGGLLGMSIPWWQARAAATAAAGATTGHPKACILLWMNGGPSHLDTFDPKPGTKIGGPFKAIKTSVPGVQESPSTCRKWPSRRTAWRSSAR